MNLRTIVAQILNEDAPINSNQSSPTVSPKQYSVLTDFQTFERTIDTQTAAAKKQLETTLLKNVGKKKVVARASKGGMGQVEQEYTIDVSGVAITYLKDEYYIVLKGLDGKEYYVNPAFPVKIIGDSTASNPAQQIRQPNQSTTTPKISMGSRSVGGIVSPQNMGISSGGPNTLSR